MTIINIFVIICLFGGLVALFRELERAYKNYKFRKEYQNFLREVDGMARNSKPIKGMPIKNKVGRPKGSKNKPKLVLKK